MTRKVAARVWLATAMSVRGFPKVGYYLLPRKMKPCSPPTALEKYFLELSFKMLSNEADLWRHVQSLPSFKVGDTITIRKPARYVVHLP